MANKRGITVQQCKYECVSAAGLASSGCLMFGPRATARLHNCTPAHNNSSTNVGSVQCKMLVALNQRSALEERWNLFKVTAATPLFFYCNLKCAALCCCFVYLFSLLSCCHLLLPCVHCLFPCCGFALAFFLPCVDVFMLPGSSVGCPITMS